MPKPISSAQSSSNPLAQEQSLRTHIILESWIQGGLPASGESLFNFSLYLDTAWVVAGQTFKSPPKVLAESRKFFRVWQSAGMATPSKEELAVLCRGVNAADTIWKHTPLPVLLDAMILMRSHLDDSVESPH